MMPKILTEMKNVGKHLRATHHLYFQTSFLRRTVGKNVFAGVPCKKLLWQNLGVPIYSRIYDKNLVITYWFRRKNSKWLQKTFSWSRFMATSNIELMKSDNFLRWVTDISWSADKTMNVGSSLCLFICIYTQINKFKQE